MASYMVTQAEVLKDYIKVNRSTLWRWVRAGKFPKPAKTESRKLFWHRSDLEQWLDKCRCTGPV